MYALENLITYFPLQIPICKAAKSDQNQNLGSTGPCAEHRVYECGRTGFVDGEEIKRSFMSECRHRGHNVSRRARFVLEIYD